MQQVDKVQDVGGHHHRYLSNSESDHLSDEVTQPRILYEYGDMTRLPSSTIFQRDQDGTKVMTEPNICSILCAIFRNMFLNQM